MANEPNKRLPIEMLCLSLLRERDMYCYEMVQEISARSGGLLILAEAALYMSMYKMQGKGYITDHRETVGVLRPRTRIYYHLEPAGDAYLDTLIDEYTRSAEGIRLFLEGTRQKEETA
ncbi:MAG: helix-turn-helix transcriptional regulator [Clostridia bacterium]|nr:helix-turn-helix transcriptional regulator [Clostridia bacterium]